MNRSNLGLFLLLLCLGGFYFGSKIYRLKSETAEIQKNRFFPRIEQDDVQKIFLKSKSPSFEYTLVRRGELWFLDGHLASFEKSPQLVNSLLELSRERTMKSSPKSEDIQSFGLDVPAYRIEVFDNDQKSLGWVELGSRDPQGNHFYGRFKSEGEVVTVPAYLLSPLEEEPETLRERSPFPVEVAAVVGFSWTLNGETTKFEKNEESEFRLVGEKTENADTKALEALFYKLKDLKVARFLGDEEKTDLGELSVAYRAKFGYTDREVVVEFGSRVAITPELLYGRRFLTQKGELEPIEGTLERFVLELPANSELLAPKWDDFKDRSAFDLVVDSVYEIQIFPPGGDKILLRVDGSGSWLRKSQEKEDSLSTQEVTGFLYALRDLRRDEAGSEALSGERVTKVELKLKDGSRTEIRFGMGKTGKPYFGQGSTTYPLEEGSWKLLSEALEPLVSGDAPVSN